MNEEQLNELDQFLMGDNDEPAGDNFDNLNIDADVIQKYLKLESRRSTAWANQSNSGSNAKANSQNVGTKGFRGLP